MDRKYISRTFYCDRCGEPMKLEDARIELIGVPNYKTIHFCHNQCSDGYAGSKNIKSDIMEWMWQLPNEVYQSLTDDYNSYGDDAILDIRKKLFGD